MFSFFSKLNLRNKIIISLGAFLLILASIIYFIILPTINDIKKIENEIESQRIDLEKRWIKGQSLKQLTENLKKIEPQLEILDQIFVKQNEEQGLGFITTLESIAEQNNVVQKINLASSPQNEDKNYQIRPIKLSVQGKFSDIMKYLISLESLDYYININSLDLLSSIPARSLNAPKNENREIYVNLAIEGNTYWK